MAPATAPAERNGRAHTAPLPSSQIPRTESPATAGARPSAGDAMLAARLVGGREQWQ